MTEEMYRSYHIYSFLISKSSDQVTNEILLKYSFLYCLGVQGDCDVTDVKLIRFFLSGTHHTD